LLKRRRHYKLLFYCFLGLSLVILGSGAFLYHQFLQAAGERHSTNYKIYSQAPFNQPSYYPLNQPISSRLYQPVGTWTGRLILPTKEQRQTVKGVLFEVHHADAAHQNLVGTRVNLRWSNDAEVQDYVQAVTQDVRFTQQTQESETEEICIPIA